MGISTLIMKGSQILKSFYIDSCCDCSLDFLQNFQISVNAKFQITEDDAISPNCHAGRVSLNSANIINKIAFTDFKTLI